MTRWPSASSLWMQDQWYEHKGGRAKNSQAAINAYRVVPDIVVPVTQSSLHNLRRLFDERSEVRLSKDSLSLFIGQIYPESAVIQNEMSAHTW